MEFYCIIYLSLGQHSQYLTLTLFCPVQEFSLLTRFNPLFAYSQLAKFYLLTYPYILSYLTVHLNFFYLITCFKRTYARHLPIIYSHPISRPSAELTLRTVHVSLIIPSYYLRLSYLNLSHPIPFIVLP